MKKKSRGKFFWNLSQKTFHWSKNVIRILSRSLDNFFFHRIQKFFFLLRASQVLQSSANFVMENFVVVTVTVVISLILMDSVFSLNLKNICTPVWILFLCSSSVVDTLLIVMWTFLTADFFLFSVSDDTKSWRVWVQHQLSSLINFIFSALFTSHTHYHWLGTFQSSSNEFLSPIASTSDDWKSLFCSY